MLNKKSMYLYLGENIVVKKKDIVGIFDLDTSTMKKETQLFLEKIQAQGNLVDVSEGILPKSLIIKKTDTKDIVYMSPLSTKTLKKRFDSPIQ